MSSPIRVGDRVRIVDRDTLAHTRTPHYVRGKVGSVIQHCGEFGEPERLALGDQEAPRHDLFRVRLRQVDLWDDYQGSSNDQLEIEIFAHWLERLS